MLRILTTAEQETLLEKYAELTRLRAAIFRAELEVTEARNTADKAANVLEQCLGVGNEMFRYWVPDVNVDKLRSVGKPASRRGVSRESRKEESGRSRIEESGGSHIEGSGGSRKESRGSRIEESRRSRIEESGGSHIEGSGGSRKESWGSRIEESGGSRIEESGGSIKESRGSRIGESGGSRIEESGRSRSLEGGRHDDEDDAYSGTENMEVIVTTISMGPALKVLRSRYVEKERVAAETARLAVEKGESLKKLRKQEQSIVEQIAAIENMTLPDK